MTLRPCRRSAESVSSSFRSGSRIYAKTTGNFYLRGPACRQPNSLNTTRSISSSLALSKGRVSWIGTLSDYASNTNTSIKPALHHQSYFDGQLRFSSSSSSSNISVSKKQGENEDVVQETGRIQAAETLPCKDDNENNAHGTDKNGDKNKSSNSDMLKATTDEETPPKKNISIDGSTIWQGIYCHLYGSLRIDGPWLVRGRPIWTIRRYVYNVTVNR